MDILIYTEKVTPRLDYVAGLILGRLLGLNYSITHFVQEFHTFSGARINYSKQNLENSLQIVPCGLLFETDILEQPIDTAEWDGMKILFPSGNAGTFPFDIFAASFFLVSRYEEYLPFTPDDHGRFEAHQSIAWQQGFLEKPVVNIWTIKLKEALRQQFPDLPVNKQEFKHISTIDIDNAWAYRHKGFFRTAGAMVRSTLSFSTKNLRNQLSVLTGKSPDPYDNYDFLEKQEKKYGFSSVYFFLVGKYGRYDKNNSFSNNHFRNLILQRSKKGPIGIHPSYRSNKSLGILKKEVQRLSGLLNRQMTKSRQHFLMVRFPDTFEKLIKTEISEDYTLGYAAHTGFRAGICTPFLFYNLKKEEETSLTLVPFMVMDITLQQYMGLNSDQALQNIKEMIDSVKAVNGTFVSLWHNESLSETGVWKGWREVYEKMLEYVYD